MNSSGGITSITVEGDTIIVSGTANQGADSTRTLWFETVAGVAFAQGTSAKWLDREVTDQGGQTTDSARDALTSGSADAFAPTTLSEDEFADGVRTRASALGLDVVSTTYIGLFGGSGEIVVQPEDPKEFVAHAGWQVAELLGELGQDQKRPYLVTVVDEEHVPLLILAYVPNVGGDQGQGLSWLAPNLQSDAVWGSTTAALDAP
ncbi:MAG: hypothetical protein WD096_11760 [Actinomycetota bacterium]